MKRSHMNFCRECRKAFEIKDNLDFCESCRILFGIPPGNYLDNEEQPEIVKEVMQRYMAYGYE